MTVTYCERHNERFDSDADENYDLQKEKLQDALNKIEADMLAYLDVLAKKHFDFDRSRYDLKTLADELRLEAGGYIADAFGDCAGNETLIDAMDVQS